MPKKSKGLGPSKRLDVRLTITDSDLAGRLRNEAEGDGRDINNMVRKLIREALDARDKGIG